MLIDRYYDAVKALLEKARTTQDDAIHKAADVIATAVESGKKVYLGRICHQIEHDLIYRGGGPIFYKEYKENEVELKEGDVLVVSSVSGRTKSVVDLAFDSVAKGVKVIAFTSMEYARAVDPVHESGKKLYEMATVTVDNCAPAAEAMMDVEGIEAAYAAASGIASDYILWSMTSVAVEELLNKGITPGILKSANFPGGNDYNKKIIEPHYDEFGW